MEHPLLQSWMTLSEKLGITEDEAFLIQAFNRNWLGPYGIRRVYVTVQAIVEKFGLDDLDRQSTYGDQLAAKGIITKAEAYLLSEGKINGTPERIEKQAESTIPDDIA